ncbi:MAG: AzlD domain-containing protein [Treponema sp.]|jgi:branched-subunit amino acid transport protein|nr:AzlD domain-containing protein [Treponema sp.]
MNDVVLFLKYTAVMASVTYAVRAVPLILCKKKIENLFIKSFLYYVPYAVLGAMTFPAIFFATSNFITALAGCITALIFAWFEKSLLTVAVCASFAVLCAEALLYFL